MVWCFWKCNLWDLEGTVIATQEAILATNESDETDPWDCPATPETVLATPETVQATQETVLATQETVLCNPGDRPCDQPTHHQICLIHQILYIFDNNLINKFSNVRPMRPLKTGLNSRSNYCDQPETTMRLDRPPCDWRDHHATMVTLPWISSKLWECRE